MSTPEKRAAKAAYMRGWHARNGERIRREGRERYAANQNGLRARSISATRLADLRRRGGVDEDTEAMLPFLQRDPCSYCGQQLVPWERTAGNGAAVDHIDPADGSHWTNLTAACRSCNASKGKVPLLLSMLERQLRRDFGPIAEQLWIIKGRNGQRRRIDF